MKTIAICGFASGIYRIGNRTWYKIPYEQYSPRTSKSEQGESVDRCSMNQSARPAVGANALDCAANGATRLLETARCSLVRNSTSYRHLPIPCCWRERNGRRRLSKLICTDGQVCSLYPTENTGCHFLHPNAKESGME